MKKKNRVVFMNINDKLEDSSAHERIETINDSDSSSEIPDHYKMGPFLDKKGRIKKYQK